MGEGRRTGLKIGLLPFVETGSAHDSRRMAERQAFQRKRTTMRMSRTGLRGGRKRRQSGRKGSYGECKAGEKMACGSVN